MLSLLSIWFLGDLIARRTALPRSVRFVTGAAAFSLVMYALLAAHAAYLGSYLALTAVLGILALRAHANVTAPLPPIGWFYRIVFGIAGLVYLINALAPEIQADAAGYHLRLVSEFVRLHTFSNRTGIYDGLPHGMEMLFIPAFALGGGGAAKLIHFVFFLLTIPLIRELTPGKSAGPAALFFLAPVCAIDGTSAYTDMGLVCGCLAVVYLIQRWRTERSRSLIVCAALCSAFCFAVKPQFGWVTLAALAFVPGARLVFLSVAVMCCSPWLVRMHLDPQLLRSLSQKYSPSWTTALLDYTIRGGYQGILGVGFLVGTGWWLKRVIQRNPDAARMTACAVLLAVPVLLDSGTRFLLPSAAFAALAIGPGPVLVAIQAAGAIPLREWRYEWRLREVPLFAALRIEPQDEYLRAHIPEYGMVKAIRRYAPPGASVFAWANLPESYLPNPILTYWQSRLGMRMADALQFARDSRGTRASLVSWRRKSPTEFTATSDIRIIEDARGQPWKLYRPGEIVPVSRDLLIWPATARKPSGDTEIDYPVDLRSDATAFIRRCGYRYLVVPADLGREMFESQDGWGVEAIAKSGDLYLFRMR